jgi:hypothetical protein
VIPHSIAPPVPQLYNTDSEPTKVFGSTLTEVWQVKIGEGSEKVAESREAWKKFVTAVAEASGSNGTEESIQGPSVNLEEKRWVGVLGWESMEVSLKCLFYGRLVKSSWLTFRSRLERKYLETQLFKKRKGVLMDWCRIPLLPRSKSECT